MKNIPKKYLELLSEFISFKSISTDTQFKDECIKTSTWIESLFNDAGFEVKTDNGQNSNPLVMAKYIVDSKLETILIYGHYDVQPASKTDGWQQNPFSVDIRDEKIIARGAIDNKGQVLVHIYTILELIKEDKLNYNIIFMIEGNEESGNDDISDQLLKYKDFLKSDYVLISDGEIVQDRPTMESSFRGGSNIKIIFTTAPNDFHSGIYGGAVPSASLSMSQLLAKLKDEKNIVQIPGFYDGIVLDEKQMELNKSLATEQEILDLSGVRKILTEPGIDFYSQTGLRPTLEISGIKSGYTDVGYLNIVPAKAEARINVRTVVGQNTQEIMDSIKKYIIEITPDYVDITFEQESASDPILLEANSKKSQEIKLILEEVYGTKLAIKNVGGSIPIVANFKNDMNMNVISVSLANEDCNMHGVDENFRIEFLTKGLEFSKKFFSK